MSHNITAQKQNPDAPPEDIGWTELKVRSDVLPLVVNRASYGLFFLHNEITNTYD